LATAGQGSRASRRGALEALLGAAVLGTIPRAVLAAAPTGPQMAPAAALQRMMDGNARFVSGKLQSFDEDLAELRRGVVGQQAPFAAVLSCADSRVPVELVFDQSIGRVFVTRVAGNVATTDVIASLEYGAAVLGVSTIMVLAHESCGAVKAASENTAAPGQITALFAPLRAAILQGGTGVDEIARSNAVIQADILRNASPLLKGMVDKGTLSVVAAYYSLSKGRVSLLS
jgi:carbonic anhydrase